MKKILLCDAQKPVNLLADHWHDITVRYFDLEIYEAGRCYDRARTLVCMSWYGASEWSIRMHEQGFKTVIDNLWEPRWRWIVSPGYDRLDSDRAYTMQCDEYFWLEESRRLCHLMDRGSHYIHKPSPTRTKLAWMPMRGERWHRDRIWQVMQPWLGEFYCSYVDRGYFLPGDRPPDPINQNQRYINPLWIDDTWFTIAVETYCDEDMSGQWGSHHATMSYLGPWPFITEKTYKPIWMQHPFMVYGQSNTLAKLRDLGFVTYDNLFDESYDVKHADKVPILVKNVAEFDRTASDLDAETRARVAHNHAWFFRRDIVQQLAIKHIFEPLMEYAEQA